MDQEIENVKTKQWVIAITSGGGVVIGQLVMQGEVALQENEVQKVYKICIIGNEYIDLYEKEIISIEPLLMSNKGEYLKDFEKRYGIKCFDNEGKVLSNSIIMGNIISKDKWDTLMESEKEEFVKCISFSNEDIVEILNVLIDYKHDAQKMHIKRKETLDNGLAVLRNYDEIKRRIPEGAVYYDFLYKQLGLDKLIKNI